MRLRISVFLSFFLIGCGGSSSNDENTSDEWKLNNIEELKKRLNGWQREAFEASYKSKQDSGLSLIKKKLLEARNS